VKSKHAFIGVVEHHACACVYETDVVLEHQCTHLLQTRNRMCMCAHIHARTYTFCSECEDMHIHARTYTFCSECANVYADIYNACLVHTCTCMVFTYERMLTLRKNAYGHVHARLCNGAEASLSRSWTPMNACLLSARMHMDTCMRAYATVQKRLCRGHGCFCTYMRAHTLHIHVRTYTFCTSAKQMCTLMFTTPVSYTPANACCSTRPMNACLLSARMHMDSCMRAYATVQKRLCRDHGSYCKLILNLARASCRLSFAACPPAGLTLFAQEIRLNPR